MVAYNDLLAITDVEASFGWSILCCLERACTRLIIDTGSSEFASQAAPEWHVGRLRKHCTNVEVREVSYNYESLSRSEFPKISRYRPKV